MNDKQERLQKITATMRKARLENRQHWILLLLSEIWDAEAVRICKNNA